MRVVRLSIVLSLAVVAVLSDVAAWAQQKTAVTAPVPAALYTAKKVFISNGSADSGLFPSPFSGDPDRAYNEFYADVQSLGRYELVSNPEDADLVFELRLFAPKGPNNANKQKGASDSLPIFWLVIYDRKSHYILWTLTQSIQEAVLQKTHDRNFDESLSMLVQYLKTLTTPAAAAVP